MAGNRFSVRIDYGSFKLASSLFATFIPRSSSDLHSIAIHFIPELCDLFLLCLSIIWGVLAELSHGFKLRNRRSLFPVWFLPLF